MPAKRVIAFCAAILCVPLAYADTVNTFGFSCITANSIYCPSVASQLTVGVTDAGGGQVLFTFTNAGAIASSITDVYFDDGTLLGIASIESGPGVDFSQFASPHNLPGGNNIDPHFETTAGFSADSDPPVQPNGVNPGEWLKIYFNLQSGPTFDDTLAALNNGDALRIGIKVQGLPDGQSESMVNGPPQAVPEPDAWLLLGAVLVGLLARAVHHRSKQSGLPV